MHGEWTDRLTAYLDGDLPEAEREELERHLAGCEGCRVVLEEVREVVAWAPTYRGLEPAKDLWAGIAAGIDQVRSRALPTTAPPRYSLRQVAVAAGLVGVVSAGAVYVALRSPGPAGETVAGGRGAQVTAVAAFDDAGYHAAIDDLQAAVLESRGRLDSATVRVIVENLALIDAAIAEARAAIAEDPSNAYLSGRVQAHMQRKLVLLRQAAHAAGPSL